MESSSSLEALLTEAENLLANGERAKALKHFQEASKTDARSTRALFGIAETTDDRDEAIHALRQIVLLDPGNLSARDRLSSLQVDHLREGLDESEKGYREKPLNKIARFGIPILIILVVIGAGVLAIPPAALWLQSAMASPAILPIPTLEALILPATWTPTTTSQATPTSKPSDTPRPTATSSVVTGRINGTVNKRSGPGPAFANIGSLHEPTPVVLVARNPDGKYYQLHEVNDDKLVWVSSDFVTITVGNPSMLPVRDVPTPTATRPPYNPPAYRPPAPTATQAIVFKMIKSDPNPYGPRCDRTLIQGTIWDRGYGNGYVPGTLVAVWLNGKLYRSDAAGSHPESFAAKTGNRAYWEVDFPQNQPVSGLVGVVDGSGKLISPQYPFKLGNGGDCHDANNVNEMVIDFSH